MVEKVVVDTSVVVKWFIKEEGCEEAREWLARFENLEVELLAPEIIFLELTNALWWSRQFELVELKRNLERFNNLQIKLVRINIKLLSRAANFWNMASKLAIYDLLFMALAEHLNLPLLTADTRHHKPEYYQGVKYLTSKDGV